MSLTEQELQTWLTFLRGQSWLNQQLAHDMLIEDRVRITWFDVLVHLERSGTGLRMQDLCEQVILSNSGMTRVVDRLIEEGYVVRDFSDQDRREVYVNITESGRELLSRLKTNHQARIRNYFLQYANPEEQATIQRVFQRILDSRGKDQC